MRKAPAVSGEAGAASSDRMDRFSEPYSKGVPMGNGDLLKGVSGECRATSGLYEAMLVSIVGLNLVRGLFLGPPSMGPV